MRTKHHLFLSLLSLFFICLSGCYKNPHKTLFLKITHPDIKHTSYIIGTIHSIPQDKFPDKYKQKAAKILLKCNTIAFEADIINIKLDSQLLYLHPAKNFLNIREQNFVKKLLLEHDCKSTFIDSLLQMNISIVSSYIQKTQTKNIINLDYEYLNYAIQENKNIAFLDTGNMLYRYFELYSNATARETLWFKNDSCIQIHNQKLDKLYQDFYFMRRNSYSDFSDTSLVQQRNSEWLPTITRLLKTDKTAIFCGAGHLNNLTTKLTNEGFVVVGIR